MKRLFTKLIPLWAMLTPMCCTLTSCSDTTSSINIIGLDDFHGCVMQYHNNDLYEERIKTMADTFITEKNKNPDNTYFILLGDNTDDSGICQFTNEKAGCDVLKSFHPKYSAVGNHEIKSKYNTNYYECLDPDNDDSFVNALGLKCFLCCNAYWYDGTTTEFCDYFQPYAIEHIGGLNVGFVGYTTAKLPEPEKEVKKRKLFCADATNDKDKFFNTGKTGVEILQDAIDACHNDSLNLNNGNKPDVVILVQHEGAFRNGTEQWQKEGSYQVVGHINGIDASMEGHSHINYNMVFPDKDGKEIPACQGGAFATYLSNLQITYNKSKTNITFNFTTPEISQTTLKGELKNDDDPMMEEIDEKLDKWYNAPCEGYGTLINKLNTELVEFDSDNIDEIVFTKSIQVGENFSRVSHLLTDFVVDEFNDTTITTKPEPLISAIEKIKNKFNVGEDDNIIDGIMSRGSNYRSDLVPSGLDKNDDYIHYLRVRDMIDVYQETEALYAAKIPVSVVNDCLSKHSIREGRIDPFYFKDYLVTWDKSQGATYSTADKVWLCDKSGNAISETTEIILMMDYPFFNKYYNPLYDDEYDHIKISDKYTDRPIIEYNYFAVNNNFPMYVDKFLGGIFDLSTYEYDEHNYLYLN